MNNPNNRGNNRRRGRNNNNRPQGGQLLNRIDSRARGNAPQLLEKYRKQAQDAHMNGDRVTAEYYLQFADHYFRVIADSRLRQEEARARRDERWQENGEADREEADESDFATAGDFPNFDSPAAYPRRDDRYRDDRPNERQYDRQNDRQNDRAREDRGDTRGWRQDRPAYPRSNEQSEDAAPAATGSTAQDNPFLRDERRNRQPRQRDGQRDGQRDEPRAEPRPRYAGNGERPPTAEPAGLDPLSLPPAISATRAAADTPDTPISDAAAEAPAAPKRRTRRKPAEEPSKQSAG